MELERVWEVASSLGFGEEAILRLNERELRFQEEMRLEDLEDFKEAEERVTRLAARDREILKVRMMIGKLLDKLHSEVGERCDDNMALLGTHTHSNTLTHIQNGKKRRLLFVIYPNAQIVALMDARRGEAAIDRETKICARAMLFSDAGC